MADFPERGRSSAGWRRTRSGSKTMENRKSQPALLLVILALLGFSALPKEGPSESPATKSATTKAGIGADSGRESQESPAPSKQRENPDIAVLGPLIALADD